LCPRQTVPAGPGVDLAPARRGSGAFGGTRLRLRVAAVSLRSFRYVVRNSGKRSRRAVLYGNCVTLLKPTSGTRERLHVRITSFTVAARPGLQRLTRRCPARWIALGTGYAVGSRLPTVEGAAALGASGRWWISGPPSGTASVTVQLVCGRLAP
jgi:hypothetical protein